MSYQYNNNSFRNYVQLIYPDELEINDTTESDKYASYIDTCIDCDGWLPTTLYGKRDESDFAIADFPFLSSNILLAPVYCVYISQLIRYTRACFVYKDFPQRGELLATKLMLQGYNKFRLKYHNFAKTRVAIIALFAITNHHWPIYWMICFILSVRLPISYWLWQRVIPYTWFRQRAHYMDDRSAEDGYSSAAPDPAFAFVGGLCCTLFRFVSSFWILITFYTLLTSLFKYLWRIPIMTLFIPNVFQKRYLSTLIWIIVL
jgi:hypothetical protein